MALSWFSKWFSRRPARPIRVDRRPRRSLSLEALESRLVPTSSTLSLVSVAAVGTTGDGAGTLGASPSAVSQDGRYVAFESAANDMVSGQTDANGVRDVFLRDRQTNTTTLVSHQTGSTSATGNFQSFDPSISADGRFVVYRSLATNLVSGQVDGSNYDVFLFDSQTGTNTLVSHASGAAATAGNNASSFARISADGNYVTFVSRSTNLLPNQSTFDLNSTDDVFLYSRATGTNALVSRTSLGGTGNGAADLPSVSDDGRYVAYRTSATNVISGVTDNNGNTDVYLYDRVTDTRALVSRSGNSATVVALGQSDAPAVSGDGAYVAFVSYAGNVVQNQSDDNLSTDVFLYSRASGTNALISHLAGDPTVAGDNYSDSPSISDDGRYVAYVSASSDVVDGQNDFNYDADVFLYDRQSGESAVVSHNYLDALTTGEYFSTTPTISADGRYVAYASVADDLVSGVADTNLNFDVFRYDAQTGQTDLVSHPDGDESVTPAQGADQPRISGDGITVVYVSQSPDLVSGDDNSKSDVFAWSLSAGNTAPTASITGVGAVRVEGTSISVTGGGVDAEQASDTLGYSWAVYKNGGATPFATGTGADYLFTPDDNGSYRLVLTVTDNGGLSASVEQTVAVSNVAPTPSIVSIGAVRVEGTSISVSGAATDPAGANDTLSYSWQVFANGSVSPFATGSGTNFAFTPDDDGSFRIVLSVSDEDGGSATAEQTVAVSNAAPAPSITSIGAVRTEGTSIAVSGTATDPAGSNDTLSYAWQVFANGGATPLATGSGSDFSFTPDDDGSYRIVLTVSDEDGGSASVEQTIAVSNAAPAPAIADIGAPRQEGTAIFLAGAGSDPAGANDALSYAWEVYKGAAATPFATASGQAASFTPDDDGSYRVVLTVSDEDGGSASAEQTLTVSNLAPAPQIVSVSPVRVEGTSIQVTGSATDPAGTSDTVSLAWEVYRDGGVSPFATGSGGNFSFTPDDDGSYRIVLTASDEDGGSASAEQTVSSSNLAPTPQIASIGSPRVEGTSIQLAGGATDPAGANDAIGLIWEVFKGSDATPLASGTGADFSFTPGDDGSYRIVLTVSDEDGGSASAEQMIAVSNAAPLPTIVSVSQVRVEGTSVAVSGSATDPAGANDTLTYSWQVFKGGGATPSATGSGADYRFTPDDDGSYRIVLTVSDEDGESATAEQTISVSYVTAAPPFYSGAFVFNNILIVWGAGVPGGTQFIPVPPGSFALFTDLTGDGKSDVVVALPNMILAADGATGRLLAISIDVNGDGFRELLIFNLDGTTTAINGRTGVGVRI